MDKFLKKIKSPEFIGISLLAILVIFAGYMVYFQKDFKVSTSIKSESNNDNLQGYNFQDYYDDYYDDNYSDYYDYNTGNYYNNYQYGYYDYSDTTPPSVKWSAAKILEQFEYYDPMEDITAHHSKFGDVTNIIEIIYNDVNTNVPGTYTTVYRACNYPGSVYCRTVSRSVTVREKGFEVNNDYYDYTKGPIFSNTKSVSCNKGSSNCSTYNISKPTAKDPVSYRNLSVSLVEGYVDIYQPGTYVLIYGAETQSGVKGTVSKIVTITGSVSSNNSSSNRPQSKYISNYKYEYYDDGYYRGYLNADYTNQQSSKYIDSYEWTNKVTYTYRCDNEGGYGFDGWTLVSADKSNGQNVYNADNHPTYYYNKNGYSGTLNKVNFYLKDSEDKLINDLGYCNNVGETKQVDNTWVGVYSGYVYSNYNTNKTYSGYVYLYR